MEDSAIIFLFASHSTMSLLTCARKYGTVNDKCHHKKDTSCKKLLNCADLYQPKPVKSACDESLGSHSDKVQIGSLHDLLPFFESTFKNQTRWTRLSFFGNLSKQKYTR